jgi:lipopolysaccharide biosynthesis glycosyltransferase
MYRGCFPDIQVQFKRWERPTTLPPLSGKGFDAEYIYSRVYLADIFHEIDRYVYLDNDAIVNMDLADLFNTPLIRATHPMTTRKKSFQKPNQAPITAAGIGKLRSVKRESPSSDPHLKAKPVAMGFVFDVNEKLRGYMLQGFNQSSPQFKRAISFIEPAKFFNGGVALVDAKKWRNDNLTRKAEAIVRENEKESLYSRRGLGDQGLFFLLLQDGIAELHPAFNMRRVPNKTTRLMKSSLGRCVERQHNRVM